MPKMKTHKGAAARFKVSGNGKLMRRHGEQSHFRRNKRKTVKRAYHTKTEVHPSDIKRMRRVLPYAGIA